MALGFFSSQATISKAPIPLLPRCGSCGLYKHCQSPKMPVAGQGKRKILVVGEAPGATEDEQNKPFVGKAKAGRLLRSKLNQLDIDLDRDCWTTNSLICWPGRGNPTPTDKQIGFCLPNLVNTVKELDPHVIVPLGSTAVKAVMGWLWKEQVGSIGRWVGWQVPCQKLNAWLCPTWHPSYLARQEGSKDYGMLEKWFLRHLRAAVKLKGRPWEEVPDYGKQLRIELDPDKAATEIISFLKGDGPVAFDFETDRLKPDHPDARVVCCSVSDGKTSLAFPWHGAAVKEMQVLLRSDLPKIGFNVKFEERWVQRMFGYGVRNWVWDGMLAAHVIDNRPDVTGLKFQSWVQLGVDSYNHDVRPFMKSDNNNGPNRLREAPLPKVLRYCAMDSLLEWQLAMKQAKQLRVEL